MSTRSTGRAPRARNHISIRIKGCWRDASQIAPANSTDFVLGLYNDKESIWVFNYFPDRGYVPVCAPSTTQGEPIHVSHFAWLPYITSRDEWPTGVPEENEPVVGIRRGSTDPEMLVFHSGRFLACDIADGVDDDSEVVDCTRWVNLPDLPLDAIELN